MEGVILSYDTKSQSGLILFAPSQSNSEIFPFSGHNAAKYNQYIFTPGAKVQFTFDYGQPYHIFVTDPNYSTINLSNAITINNKSNVGMKSENTNDTSQIKMESINSSAPRANYGHSMSIDDSNSLRTFTTPQTDNNQSVQMINNDQSDLKENSFSVPKGRITARDLKKRTVIAQHVKTSTVYMVVVKPHFFGGNIVCYDFMEKNQKGGYTRHEITNNNISVYNYHQQNGTENKDKGAFIFIPQQEVEPMKPQLDVFFSWWDEMNNAKQAEIEKKRMVKLKKAKDKREKEKEIKNKYAEEVKRIKEFFPHGSYSDNFLIELLNKHNGDLQAVQVDADFIAHSGI